MFLTNLDYELLVSSMNKEIRSINGNIVIKEQQNVKQEMAYPFATYSINNPYLNAKTYSSSTDEITQSIEVVLSYTFYSQNSFECMSLAQKALSNFKQRGTLQNLWERGISVIDVSNIQNRDTFITVDVERRVGFDVRTRVKVVSNKEMRDIIDVVLQDGTTIEKNDN